MAVTATFKADFSSFTAAVEKAEVKLRSFETGASKVEKSLSRMTDSFSGRRVIQEATLTAKAIDDIGGVSKLTENELKRVSSQAQEAAAKLKAMGMDVPPGIQKIADATKDTSSAFDKFKGALGSVNGLLGAFGVGLSVSAVVGFGKALLDDADALVKMSDKTGISIQGLQRLQVAGDDAGNTIEEMSSAINQMQNRLVGGDASATGALQKLGMSFADIKNLSPDQQFMAISDALRGVEDPAQQVAIAMDLFGKSGASVLPTLKRGFDDVRDAAVGMSEDTAQALDKMGDDFQAFYRTTKGVAAGVAVELYRVVQDGLNPLTYGFNSAKREVESWDKALAGATEAAGKTAPNLRAAFGAEVQTEFKASESALKAFDREMAESTRQHEMAASAAKRHKDELAQLRARIAEINMAAAAPPVAPPVFNLGAGNLPGLSDLRDMVSGQDAAARVQAAVASGGAAGLATIGQQLPALMFDGTSSGFSRAVSMLPELLQRSFTGGGGMSGAFSSFGSMLGGELGGKLFAAGGPLNGLGNKLAGLFGSSLGLALPGIGSVVGSLLGAALPKVWNGIKKLFGGPSAQEMDGRALEKDFEQSFGTFNNMVESIGAAYRATGRTSEQAQRDVKALLDAEREGPAAVQAWIDRLRAVQAEADALNAQTNAATTATVNAQAEQMQKALDDLAKRRDDLLGSIANEAPEEVMGVIEAQTRGQIAALDAEMEAQRAAMKANAEDGASAAVVAIKDEFSDLEIHVPIVFDIPRVPGFPIEQPEPVPGASTGAKVLPFGIQHLAGGGWARGTDTVPAMLTPGELVLNAAQQKNVARAMSGSTSVVINVNNPSFDTPAGRAKTLRQMNRAFADELRRTKRMAS